LLPPLLSACPRWQQQREQQAQAQQPPVQQQQRPQGQPGRGVNGGGDRDRQGDFRRDGNRGNFQGSDGRRDNGRPGFQGNDGRRDNVRPDFQGNDGRRDNGRPDIRGNDGRNGYNNGQGWRGGQQGRDYGRPGYGGNNRPQWRNDWRGDNRYDWRGWRDRNRNQFHAPRYQPPRGFGWGYRSFSIGYRLDRLFYAQNYWINDPWEYRLPPVYGPYRWVRYYNDAILVDIDSGEVVDVIQNFFW
jgi:hypothetical protein